MFQAGLNRIAKAVAISQLMHWTAPSNGIAMTGIGYQETSRCFEHSAYGPELGRFYVAFV